MPYDRIAVNGNSVCYKRPTSLLEAGSAGLKYRKEGDIL